MTAQPTDVTAEARAGEMPEAVSVEPGSSTYMLSRDGRRTATILLVGVISIWVFALWSLITILEDGITGVEWVSALLMLGILLVAPLVAWTLLEEINSRIIVSDEGVRYRSLGGIDLAYGWDDLAGFEQPRRRGRIARFFLGDEEQATPGEARSVDAEDETLDEPDTKLLTVHEGHSARAGSPIVDFLHRQAHGGAVPIYGGLENREELLGQISARLQKIKNSLATGETDS